MNKLVGVPDVAFVRWEKFPQGKVATEPIPSLTPDLAVEILSVSNTAGEIRRKLKEYFLAGTSVVWLVDPIKRTVRVYTAPDASETLEATDTLKGGSLLLGFSLPLRQLFEKLPTPIRKGSRKK